MKNHVTLLSSVLVVQLVLASVLFSVNSNINVDKPALSIVGINKDDIKSISIKDNESEIILSKVNGAWTVHKYPDLPVIDSKITTLANELMNAKVKWPVTATSSSHERFKVATNNYEKLVTFTDINGNSEELLLGESPSYRQLYVRNEKHDEVYSIEYSSYQANTKAVEWLDKSLLSIDKVAKITTSNMTLHKIDDDWQPMAPMLLGEEKVIDNDKITKLVSHLKDLSISSISDKSPEPQDNLVVTDENNKQYTYAFASENNDYLIKRDDYNYWFSLPKVKFERIAQVSLDDLTTENKKEVLDEDK